MQLSPHFTLEEFLVSETAVRRGINNTPSDATVENLKRLCERLEMVRALFNRPIIITSGYRCESLNAAVGGSPTSAHMSGRAADFIIPGVGSPLHIATRITKYPDIVFDQLINEYDSWVHFAIEEFGSEPRSQTMTYKRDGSFFTFLC